MAGGAAFDAAIATGTAPDAPWKALQTLARTLVGAKLFATMTIDDIAKVFPNDEAIRSLGFGSVVNLLHEEHCTRPGAWR